MGNLLLDGWGRGDGTLYSSIVASLAFQIISDTFQIVTDIEIFLYNNIVVLMTNINKTDQTKKECFVQNAPDEYSGNITEYLHNNLFIDHNYNLFIFIHSFIQ